MCIVQWEYTNMHKAIKHKQLILDNFYLDANCIVRRSKDGYLNRFKKGDEASFHRDAAGYARITLPKLRESVNRSHVVVILSGLDIPKGHQVDHIDGNTQNDHISNLRVVTERVNYCNRRKRVDNTSGITGINWSDYHGHYVIRRTVNGKRLSRNRKTLQEAILVLEDLKKLDSAYTQRHGK